MQENKREKQNENGQQNKQNRNCCLEGKKKLSSYFGTHCGTIKSKYMHRHHFFISLSWGTTQLNQLIKRSNNAFTHARTHAYTYTHAHTIASSLPFVMKNVLGVCFSFFLPSGELVSNFAPSASSSPGNTMLWKVHKETVAALPIIYVESPNLTTTAIFCEFTDWAHTHKITKHWEIILLMDSLLV